MIDVNIEQVREALSKPNYPTYTVMGKWLRQMADEIERLRSEVEDLETPPHNAMQKENETAMMHDEIERLRAENDELKRQSDNANNYIQSLKR